MRRLAALSLPFLSGVACLPGDTRPPPAEIHVTVASSPLTLSGIPATTDGFELSIERLLVNVGEATVDNDVASSACNEYSSPGYTRLFDFAQVESPRELGVAFATGHCAFGYSVRFPNYATLIDHGATSDDATLMRTPGSDRDTTDAGVSVYIEGVAVSGGQTQHFAWPFRKRVRYEHCGIDSRNGASEGGAGGDSGEFDAGLSLSSNQKTKVNLEIHAEALFQNRADLNLYFAPFAQADADQDGEITFDELWTVPLDDVLEAGFPPPPDRDRPPMPSVPHHPVPPGYFCYDSDGNSIVIATLGDYAYCVLLPELVRFEGSGECETMTGRAKDE